MRHSLDPKYRKYVQGYGFFHLQEHLEINIEETIRYCNKSSNRCCKNCF